MSVSTLLLLVIGTLWLAEPAVAAPLLDDALASAGQAQEPPAEGEPSRSAEEAKKQDERDVRPPGRGRGMVPAGRGGGRGAGPMGRGGGMGGPVRGRHFQLMDRLLPLIERNHPDLARRLVELRDTAPEEFERVLGDALALRFERALERRAGGPMSPGGRRPPGMPPGPHRGEPEMREQQARFEREMQELERRNEELERHSVELAQRYNELRERPEPELREERGKLRRRIEETVEEHFNVRTELRGFELRRIETELEHLRGMVDRIRGDLERREQARGSIIEGRLKRLLGEEEGDW